MMSFTMKKTAMAAFAPKLSSIKPTNAIRSISLPARSHPTTVRIEEELNKLRFWKSLSSPTSSKVETICSGLSGLAELYRYIQNLLHLPLTQQALSQHRNEKWVDELLDCPLRFLDILSNTRDAILLMKETVRELQSALRRRRKFGDLSIERNVSEYWSLRRNMRKECMKSLLLLKQIDGSFGVHNPLDLNDHLCAIVRVLREASLIASSIFQSLLVFLSSPLLKSKCNNKWVFVSRLVQKRVFACNNQQETINELEKVDFALDRLVMENPSKDIEAERIQSANRKLEALDEGIERLENGLECLYKHLINTRVSFLNIFSP